MISLFANTFATATRQDSAIQSPTASYQQTRDDLNRAKQGYIARAARNVKA